MSSQELILKRASASRPSGKWNEDDYDVLADDVVVGRIMKAIAAPVGSPWFWTLAFGYHRDRRPTHGYAATRDAKKRAAQAKDLSVKKAFEEVARGWLVLAEQMGIDRQKVDSRRRRK